MGRKAIDMSGMVFGSLIVRHAAIRSSSNGGKRWVCECACGKLIEVDGSDLRRGHHRSCGCKRSELLSAATTANHANMSDANRQRNLDRLAQGRRNRWNQPGAKKRASLLQSAIMKDKWAALAPDERRTATEHLREGFGRWLAELTECEALEMCARLRQSRAAYRASMAPEQWSEHCRAAALKKWSCMTAAERRAKALETWWSLDEETRRRCIRAIMAKRRKKH